MQFDRRQLLRLGAAATTGILASAAALSSDEHRTARSKKPAIAVAFDGFVIFDPRPIAVLAEQLFPGNGAALVTLWKTRQFEYSWLRTLTRTYVDFWQVTDDALTYSAKQIGIDMDTRSREQLLGAFLNLKVWPDVPLMLDALKSANIRLSFLSNFTSAMLDANIRSAGIEGFFEQHLSTDRVRLYKPASQAYQMGVDYFQAKRQQIVFAAFGGWDAAGAKSFGYPVYWCNRQNQPPEELGVVPDIIESTAMQLPEFVLTNS